MSGWWDHEGRDDIEIKTFWHRGGREQKFRNEVVSNDTGRAKKEGKLAEKNTKESYSMMNATEKRKAETVITWQVRWSYKVNIRKKHRSTIVIKMPGACQGREKDGFTEGVYHKT